MNVASDMIDGKSFQNSTKSRLKEVVETFVMSNPIIYLPGSEVRPKLRMRQDRVGRIFGTAYTI